MSKNYNYAGAPVLAIVLNYCFFVPAAAGKWVCSPSAGMGWNCSADTVTSQPKVLTTTLDTFESVHDPSEVSHDPTPSLDSGVADSTSHPGSTPLPADSASLLAQARGERFDGAPVDPNQPDSSHPPLKEAPAVRPYWSKCSTHYSQQPHSAVDRQRAPVMVTADQAETDSEDKLYLIGHVRIERADQRFTSEEVVYDRATRRVKAQGQTHYQEPNLEITATGAELDLETETGQWQNADYRLYPRHSRGRSETADLLGQNKLKLNKATYTTCDPGNNDWQLEAHEVHLDQTKGRGTARDVTVRIRDFPVLYTPYLSFPLDDRRKSGFLTPRFGRSQESGTEFAIPYYWNIAPNYDATITPRVLSERGVQVHTEFRYLTAANRGQLDLEVLPDDRKYGGNRGLLSLKHYSTLAGLSPRLSAQIDVSHVSDDDYFRDLGTNLNIASQTQLERRADLSYGGDFLFLQGRVQSFQNLDKTLSPQDRPYKRLPQLLLHAELPKRYFGLRYQLYSELVHFDRDEGITGMRLDTMPSISWPLRSPAGFIEPRVSLRYTLYNLQDTGPALDASPTRTLPLFSVDSGLFLERRLHWGGQSMLHTLEPHLYYLYVPSRDQDDIPIFDTGDLDFSFASLFIENRFTGADRIGDANQLTLALTSRLLDPFNGLERMRITLGQILYFEDRDITLPGQLPMTEKTSPLVADFSTRLTQSWSTIGNLQWDPEHKRTQKGNFQFHYQPKPRKILNLGYRFLHNDINQTDISLLWPLSFHWSFLGRWNYSLEDNENVETFAGLEYDACCWTFRALGRQYVNGEGGKNTSSFFVQVELKGLGGFGKKLEDVLERGILGYRSLSE